MVASADGGEMRGRVTVVWGGAVAKGSYATAFRFALTRTSVTLWVESDTAVFQVEPPNLRRAEQRLAALYADVQAGK